MTRRALLASLAAAFVLDPERLLWKPGAKLISIPNRSAPFAVRIIGGYLAIGDQLLIEGKSGLFAVLSIAQSSALLLRKSRPFDA
jgi:hypothetical protein